MPEGQIHPCARCASMQRTCCQTAQILVTPGDIDRIARHTSRTDFWERSPVADAAYLDQDDDPIWIRATVAPDGTRRVLKRSNQGCTFLGRAGCVLPTDVRPLVCRLYPFSYTERGIDGELPDYCPTSVLAPPGSGLTMITVLGMTRDEGDRWHAQLYAELRADLEARQAPAGTGPR
ncbi:MAG: YkgJ family cysteine cluster protein [Planctomycetota bacterium]|nr:YkgJ family cysteine cluster protein [Planctomycetota bacterium]